MIIKEYTEASVEDFKKIKLRLLASGLAKVDTFWKDSIVNTPYSRLYFVLEGDFFIITPDGKRWNFNEGNAYLIPTGSSYTFGCEGSSEHLFFHLQFTSFDRIDLLKSFSHPVGIPFDKAPDYYRSLILTSGFERTIATKAEIYSTVSRFIEAEGLLFEDKEYSKEIRETISYIREKLTLKLSVKELADNIHISESSLTRKFRRETGMSIGEYIDSLIMFYAEQKLVLGEMSIEEISELYGFCDRFYFSRRFKEKFGLSPSQYKKRPIM